jgi:tetratricopeptide (TPR) repeat protein
MGDEVHGQNRNGDDGFVRATPHLFPPDPEHARFLFQVAGKKGHPMADSALRYLDQKPSDTDSSMAIALLDKAMSHEKKSKDSLVDAYNALSFFFHSYRLDPTAKEGLAAYGLYRIYREDRNGVLKDSTTKNLWWQKAADAYNPEAMQSWIYRYSREKDYPKEKALEFAQELLKRDSEPKFEYFIWDAIAMAYARNGLFDRAIQYELKAIEGAEKKKDLKAKILEYERRLELYKKGVAYPPSDETR